VEDHDVIGNPFRRRKTLGEANIGGTTSPDRNLSAIGILDYILDGMQTIDGWGIDLFVSRLFLILNHYQLTRGCKGSLFEIGVHHGKSAILIALMAAVDEHTVFLDLFGAQEQNIDQSGRGDLETFKTQLKTWAPRERHVIVEHNSLTLDFRGIAALSSGIRFAHIDGGHNRTVVLNDLYKTTALMCDGGIIVVDDFTHMGFPEVNEACNYYLEQGGGNLRPVAVGHNKLVLTTEKHQTDLYRHLNSSRLLGASFRKDRVVFHGVPVVCLDRHD
jgi:hypothetical protein